MPPLSPQFVGLNRPRSPVIVPWSVDFTRFALAGATKFDPNNAEDPANRFVDAADGSVSGGLIGGLAINDPGSGVFFTRPALDIFGDRLVGSDVYHANPAFREITPPANLSDDVAVSVGVCNEADLNSGTVDGFGLVFRYAAGTRTIGVVSIANGAPTLAYDATPSGNSRRAIIDHARWDVATGRVPALYVSGLTDANPAVEVAGDQISAGGPSAMTGNLFWYLAFFRTSADADTVALASMVWHYGMPPPVSRITPT